jgi:serine phosphatase RsbU (regulator of sigma subunit)
MSKLYLINLFQSVTYAGLKLAKAPINRKGILFINRMSIVNTALMLLFSLTIPFFNLTHVLIFTIPFTLLFALPPWLNSKGYFAFTRYYFSIIPLVFLLCVCIHNNANMGDKYFILTTAAIPLILFRDRNKIYVLFALNVAVFMFIAWYQNNFTALVSVPDFISSIYFICAQLAVFTVIFFIILSFRNNNEAFEQELEEKNRIISLKNHEIIDSIVYAKRLQEAIMPPQEEIYKHVPESFILYKPKDIVAGDFYFAEQKGDYFFVAAADCTGHGVPGAFVSVVCSSALNKAVLELNLTEPGEILDKVTELVVETFMKSGQDVKDGMDISLCAINTKTLNVSWAGANNPLWMVCDGELQEIKATKQPVGKNDQNKHFTTHVLELAKGTLLYLFTDGFADQFGGPQGKKFKYKQLAELILSTKGLSMKQQCEKLENAFLSWKGNIEQVDDVCIIGLRL